MNYTQNIPNILQRLADTNSSNVKKTILEETKSDLLSAVFKQAYDPFVTFGTVKINTIDIKYNEKKKIDKKWFDELFNLLKKLEDRKLTGNTARDKIKIFISDSPEKWGQLVLNILKKDLRIGAGKSLINKVYSKLFIGTICMSAMKCETKKVKFPIYADVKLDGIRCISNPTKKYLVSRNGKEFRNYPFIASELEKLELSTDTKLDGEIVLGHFQDIMRTVSRKEDGIELAKDAIYNIFDIIIENKTLHERLQSLYEIQKTIDKKNLTHLKIIKGENIQNEKNLLEFYNTQLKNGFEGIMVKDLDKQYEFKRSRAWLKMKPEETIDLLITDVEKGTGKYKDTLGAIVCKLPNGSKVHVGSGFSDDERHVYWAKKEVLIGMMTEIKYQEMTKDGSLRFPIFLKFRPDL